MAPWPNSLLEGLTELTENGHTHSSGLLQEEDTDGTQSREEMHRTESRTVPDLECPDVLILQNRKSRVLLELHHVGMTDHPRD